MSDIEEEKTIELLKPITLGKGDNAIVYSEIKLREPLAGEIEKAQRADTSAGAVITLVHLIGKVPRGVAEQLCQRDFTACDQYLSVFTNAGQPAAADGQS